MKATKENFKKKMQKLSIDQIVDLIRSTWDDCTGELFREIGFEIIEERLSEEESDRIYSELWSSMNCA